jgi:large subunit ribosomal protein L25
MAKTQPVTALTIHTRSNSGTTGANAVRREGKVPGVLYGHGGSVSIAIDAKALAGLIASGGSSHIVDATIDGAHDSVLLRSVQRHPITRRAVAVDFQRVSQTEAIYATVHIVVVGVAPGVKDEGGVLDVVTHALEIKGPAGKLPEHLEVDISHLGVNDHVTAANVTLPAGFTLITPGATTVVAVEGSRTGSADTAIAEADAAVASAASAASATAAEAPAAT